MITIRRGIDVSTHQGFINFDKVSKDDIDFAILRCGYAERADSMFDRNVRMCDKYGIDIVGIYLFSYALDTKQALAEARFAVSQARKMGLDPDKTIIFFDLEYDTIRYAKQKGVTIGKRECMKHTVTFCDEVETQGFKAGVYFNLDYYRNMYEPELLNRYVKWLADWTGGPDVECDYQQYTASGRVSGIDGDCDLNLEHNRIFEEDTDKDKPVDKELLDIVDDVLKGYLGNNPERVKLIEEQGFNADDVQTVVNDYVKTAEEVIQGKWSNGSQRKELLEDFGYDYRIVQDHVNRLLK